MRGDGRDNVGIHVEDATLRAFLLLEGLKLVPERRRRRRRAREERRIALIRRVVQANELGRIDLLLPFTANETFPCGSICAFHKAHIIPQSARRVLA